MIAGFPGETDEEFSELVRFIEDFRFDALGVFPYSLEPDTPAGRMKSQLAEEVKAERVDTLMQAQQDVAFAMARERKGKRFQVLVDGHHDGGVAVARHQGQAPSVDSVTIVERCDASAGSLVDVRCTGHQDYDLIARPTDVSLAVVGS
jgi:ribosomal protein S12 methylthiotransferase